VDPVRERRQGVTLTVALSKGRLLAEAEAIFMRAGLPFPNADSRRLVVEADGLRFLFVRDKDVPVYVEYGVADCGIAGRDILLETQADVYAPLDLGIGRCRVVLAARAEAPFEPRGASTIRVATKYPALAASYFRERGVSAEVVTLSGSVELAPSVGLADCIVDVVQTGRTLAENGLRVVEEVADSTGRLIVNRASFHARRDAIQDVVARLRGAL
jgi:ATP phosphoribosyltransferase